jgi:hypothetical protein
MVRQKYVSQWFCLTFFFAYAVATIGPLRQFNGSLNTGLMKARERLNRIEAYSRLRAKVHAAADLKRLEYVDAGEALSAIQKLAKNTGVVLEYIRLKNQEGSRQSDYKIVPFDVSFSGPDAGLMRFLIGVRSLEFLCRITNLHIRSDPGQDGLVKAQMRLEKIDLLPAVFAKDLSGITLSGENKKNDNEYTDAAEKRKLFKGLFPLLSKNVHVALAGRQDVMRDLNLVGIIDDGGIKAVLEDKKTQKTLFLSKGDSIEGLTVYEIRENEVVFKDGESTFNLVL